MKTPRSVIRTVEGAPREFLSIAVRVVAATGGKDGFFVQLVPDMRGPQSIYVSPAQLERLLALAETGAPDAEVWTELAKIPLEPVAPARGLYARLRSLLVDCAPALREEISAQRARAEARARPLDPAPRDPASGDEGGAPAVPHPQPRPLRDPDAL
jgi:hypothetical protein